MVTERTVFAFLPYLITQERVEIYGIEFRSNKDIADLPTEVQEHLTTLGQMFFLEHGVRIEKMICTYLDLPEDKDKREAMLDRLHNAHLLVSYMYCHPDFHGRVFLSSENSTMFIFTIGDMLQPGMVWTGSVWQDKYYQDKDRLLVTDSRDIPSTDYTPGYYGTRNNTSSFCAAKGCRIFPEIPHVVLNYSQDMFVDVQRMFSSNPGHWALYNLYFGHDDYLPELKDRVFAALEWYMRSCRDSIGKSEALVHLAIALETLLKVREGKELRERLKEAVLALLGPIQRLDELFDQFYTARSKVVHEGSPHEVMFILDKEKPHRPLVEYGRRVFRFCVSSLLAGATLTHIGRLEALFVSNEERIAEIHKLLNGSAPAEEQILSIGSHVDELCDYSYKVNDPGRVSVSSIVCAVKRVLKAYTDAVSPIKEAVKNQIDKITSTSGDPTVGLIEEIKACALDFRSGVPGNQKLAEVHRIVVALMDYASKPDFKLQCYPRPDRPV